MDRLADLIARKSGMLALIVLASVVVPLWFLPQLQIDNSIEVWLRRDSSEYQTYRQFLDRYGSEEFVVIGVEVAEPFAPEALRTQRALAEKLGKIEGVAEVLSLPGVARALWGDNAADWPDRARGATFLNNLLLGPDGKTVGLFVWLDQLPGPDARRRTVESVEASVRGSASSDFRPHLAGTPVMNVALDRGSHRASGTFLPLAAVLCIVMLAVMLRNVSSVVASLAAVGVSAAWTMGIFTMTGRTLNMVTATLPALLFVLALAHGIHLCTRFAAHLSGSAGPERAVRDTLRELVRPLLLSSITTAIGFASLIICPMQPVREFGLFAAIGMLAALVCNLAIVPGVMVWLCRLGLRPTRTASDHWSGRSGAAIARRGWPVVTAAVVLLAGCAVGAAGTRTESNVLRFFPADSPIAQDYAFVGERLTGFYTVELDVTAQPETERAVLGSMGRLAESITTRPEAAKVMYPGDFLALQTNLEAQTQAPARLDGAARFPQQMADRFRCEDEAGRVRLRMSVLVRAMASADFYPLLDFIDEQAESHLGSLAAYDITGVVPLLNDVQRSLIETQVRSFAVAAVVVLVLIGLFFRSLRALLASLLPNLLPVFAMFALMAAAGIPLDPGTVMVASVAIGIAADDTVHFLSAYQREARASTEADHAAGVALAKAGRAMFYTSIVAAAGFGILCLSDFQPIVYFGLLTGVTMVTALASDLFVLPACVKVLRLWVIFASPRVLESLIAKIAKDTRLRIRGVHLGGMAVTAELRAKLTWGFPNAVILSGYGNTLFGMMPELHCAAETGTDYFPYGRRLVVRVIPRSEEADAQRMRATVPYGERGQVMVHRLDELQFIPNMIERDTAVRIHPPETPSDQPPETPPDELSAGAAEGFCQDGLREPLPITDEQTKPALGLY